MKKTILVIDDNDGIHEAVKLLLDEYFTIISVMNPGLALKTIGENQVDLILLDESMPEKDGFQLLSEIQQAYPGIPVVMLTAHSTDENVKRALKSGCIDFIKKIFDSDDFMNTVFKILGKPDIKPKRRRAIDKEAEENKKKAGKIIENMKANNCQDIKEVAKKFNMSVRRVNELLLAEVGKKAKDFMYEHLVEKSKDKLRGTKDKIKDIWETLGFGSECSFYRLFRKFTKQTPEEFRDANSDSHF